MTARLASIAVGPAAMLEVGGQCLPSAIRKTALSTFEAPRAVAVHELGVEGDAQADAHAHGGLQKAVYMYPASHYAFWRTVRMQALQRDEALPYGFLGENFTVEGLDEGAIWIGDELRVGETAYWVTGPRAPCAKLDAHMGFKHAAKMMWQSGYTGWYLMVKRTGEVRAGDAIELLPGPRAISLAEAHAGHRRRAQHDRALP